MYQFETIIALNLLKLFMYQFETKSRKYISHLAGFVVPHHIYTTEIVHT
jgi:hypothetical protein